VGGLPGLGLGLADMEPDRQFWHSVQNHGISPGPPRRQQRGETMADRADQATTSTAPEEDAPELRSETPAPEADLLDTELLIEEVSIDGMCGVY
jgi:mycofactocin precursor